MNIYVDSKLSDKDRRAELYRGSIFVQTPTPAALSFCQFAKEMIEEAFRPMDPLRIHEQLPVEKCAEILATQKPKFIHHPHSKEYIQTMLSEVGCDLSRTYFDVPRMRTAFPGDYLKSRTAYAFHPHRDTWCSAPFCQINFRRRSYTRRCPTRPVFRATASTSARYIWMTSWNGWARRTSIPSAQEPRWGITCKAQILSHLPEDAVSMYLDDTELQYVKK
jgi:hypothetical protein